MYVDRTTTFTQDQVWDFKALFSTKDDAVPIKWKADEHIWDLNSDGIEYLSFEPIGHSIRAIHRDIVTKLSTLVTRELFGAIVDSIKSVASGK